MIDCRRKIGREGLLRNGHIGHERLPHYLPNYPSALTDSKDLWYFGQGVLAAPNETSLNPPCKGQVVHAVKVSDTEYQVYMTRNVHFARITIRSRGG